MAKVGLNDSSIEYQHMQSPFKTDLSFKLFTSNPVVQDLDTGVKQLQPCQVPRTGNKEMDFFFF